MTPPEDTRRRVARAWLDRADSDLGVARHLLEHKGVFPEAIAFHAQQAGEKYLKALLVWRQTDFPKTHDLGLLLDLVANSDEPVAQALSESVSLTPYGVQARYPGDEPGVELEEARDAFKTATRVAEAIRARLREVIGREQ